MWNMPFPEQEMAEWFFRVRIYSYLQKMAGRKLDFSEAVEHPVIRRITLSAQPQTFYLRLTKRLVMSRSYKTLRLFLTVVVKVKQNNIHH